MTQCPCLANKNSCSVCKDGYHIFCNRYPHGEEQEAYAYFISHPEVTQAVYPIGKCQAHENALKEIEEKDNAITQ